MTLLSRAGRSIIVHQLLQQLHSSSRYVVWGGKMVLFSNGKKFLPWLLPNEATCGAVQNPGMTPLPWQQDETSPCHKQTFWYLFSEVKGLQRSPPKTSTRTGEEKFFNEIQMFVIQIWAFDGAVGLALALVWRLRKPFFPPSNYRDLMCLRSGYEWHVQRNHWHRVIRSISPRQPGAVRNW